MSTQSPGGLVPLSTPVRVVIAEDEAIIRLMFETAIRSGELIEVTP